MSAIFFKHKRRKRDPIAIFSLKNPNTFIVKLRRTHEKLDFLTIDRNKYQISIDQLDDCVQACLDKGLLIVPVTEEVETASCKRYYIKWTTIFGILLSQAINGRYF